MVDLGAAQVFDDLLNNWRRQFHKFPHGSGRPADSAGHDEILNTCSSLQGGMDVEHPWLKGCGFG